ncbi:BatD family protein [Candidatus Poribacteria bacterium]|nr:BatD family protein [Candidatus Poribacteria bacterium]
MRKTGSTPKSMWHHRYCVIAILLITTVARCQDVTVAAVITPRNIQINERARLDLKMSGKTLIGEIGQPTFNFLPNFLAVPLPTKTTPRLIEDKVAVEMEWSYELIPQKIGKIELSEVEFTYQNTNFFANPGTIIVGAVDTFKDTSTGGIHRVHAEVSNKNPYIYEPIEYKFRYLFSTVLPTVESPTKTLPSFKDVSIDETVDEVETTGQINSLHYEESIQTIYPEKVGKIIIPSAELKLPIKGRPRTLKTEKIAINVQQLPIEGRPAHFTGTVGDYTISAQIDRIRLVVRDALTMTVKFTGNGNHNSIKPPIIQNIDGFRVDPPVLVNSKDGKTPEFSFVFIPLKPGILNIPPVAFASFNTKTRSYQTTYTTPFPITVVPRPSDIIQEEESNYNWVWVSLIVVSIVLIGGYFGIRLYRKHSKKVDKGFVKDSSTSPSEEAISELKSLGTNTSDNTRVSFGDSVTRILQKYICDLIGIEYQQLSTTELEKNCSHLGLSEVVIQDLLDILSKCKYHKYAPVSISVDEQNVLLERTEKLIKLIEENL